MRDDRPVRLATQVPLKARRQDMRRCASVGQETGNHTQQKAKVYESTPVHMQRLSGHLFLCDCFGSADAISSGMSRGLLAGRATACYTNPASKPAATFPARKTGRSDGREAAKPRTLLLSTLRDGLGCGLGVGGGLGCGSIVASNRGLAMVAAGSEAAMNQGTPANWLNSEALEAAALLDRGLRRGRHGHRTTD